uniref:Uncharacterized protein n=1 Tax=Anguilla anguilla TaxID=7936 RepID=A0A0E9QG63_ANGAN
MVNISQVDMLLNSLPHTTWQCSIINVNSSQEMNQKGSNRSENYAMTPVWGRN